MTTNITLSAVEDSIEAKDELTFRVQVREYAKETRVVVFATYTGWEYDYEVEVTSAEFENGETQIVVTAEEIAQAKSYLDNYAEEMAE
jgi:hypothetical protein